ncbi:hypothetical protein K0I73_17675 [Shewanella mesophila]|uniref:hypothetical protein n=1 Tax=Shewanella mesophila TaxID=2864208 RepID=UPI001C6558C1|nr:hypothetical protein [Shewanella mesophila]QYJ85969.1 hypothetical protein K0I73_17675 [Shewanella mesophila]
MAVENNRVKQWGPLLFLLSLASADLLAGEEKSLSQKADDAKVLSQQTEQTQLDKARQAVKENTAREQKVVEGLQPREWEDAQREKAKKQFNERESREEKYLREAKEAAAQERKIPKP